MASTAASTSPRPRFDATALASYTRAVLSSTLARARYDPSPDQVRSQVSELSTRIKDRMRELSPKGFKFLVCVSLTENLGQQGRAALSAQWEPEADTTVTEVFTNDSLICVVTAFAVRTY